MFLRFFLLVLTQLGVPFSIIGCIQRETLGECHFRAQKRNAPVHTQFMYKTDLCYWRQLSNRHMYIIHVRTCIVRVHVDWSRQKFTTRSSKAESCKNLYLDLPILRNFILKCTRAQMQCIILLNRTELSWTCCMLTVHTREKRYEEGKWGPGYK